MLFSPMVVDFLSQLLRELQLRSTALPCQVFTVPDLKPGHNLVSLPVTQTPCRLPLPQVGSLLAAETPDRFVRIFSASGHRCGNTPSTVFTTSLQQDSSLTNFHSPPTLKSSIPNSPPSCPPPRGLRLSQPHCFGTLLPTGPERFASLP